MKKILVFLNLLLILLLISCKKDSSLLPIESSTNAEITFTKEKIPLFINVVSENCFILPEKYLGQAIEYEYDKAKIAKNGQEYIILKDGTIKITAKINNIYDEYLIESNNKKISSLTLSNLKINYLFTKNKQKIGPKMIPNLIVFHNTANVASSYNEVKYLASNLNTNSTSFHFAVDDLEIWQAIPLTNAAYHAGNYLINLKSIGIEIAKSKITSNEIKDKAILNAINLIKILLVYYDLTSDSVIPHQEASGKYCPHDILDRNLMSSFYEKLQI